MSSSNYRINPDHQATPLENGPKHTQEPSRPARDGEIPIIDIAPLFAGNSAGIEQAASEVYEACSRIGFFYIVNHNVPADIVEQTFLRARQFFDQPQETKSSLAFNEFHRGYKTTGNIVIPGYPPDLKEVLDLGMELSEDHPDVISGKPLHGLNQWPEISGFREDMLKYYAAVSNTAFQLLRLFALALNLDETFFHPFHREPFVTWRIMRYPPGGDSLDQYGTAPHTDFGTLTLLAQDDKGGLEVCNREGEWIQAPCIPDSLVVNIGNLMAIWTNDIFTSTAHRVVNSSGADRHSIPVFYNPGFDSIVECLPSCRSEFNPPEYEPVHFGNYLTAIYNKIFTNNPDPSKHE